MNKPTVEFQVGDLVRIIPERIDGFLVSHQNRVANRVALVDRVFCYFGEDKKRYIIIWQKRNGRGKEFSEVLHSTRDFEVVK